MLFMFSAQSVSAQMRVVFFPTGAEVTSSSIFTVSKDSGESILNLNLPGHARPETLTVSSSVPGISVTDVIWTRDNISETPAVAAVRKDLDKAVVDRDSIAAKIKAVDGGIAYWSQGNAGDASRPVLSEKLSDMVVANLSEYYSQKSKLTRSLADQQKKVEELQAKLREVSGKNLGVWKVKVSVSGLTAPKAEFTLKYMVDGCGWSPVYSLDANPDSKQVNFRFDAKVRQAAGFDLKNTEVELATVRPGSRISPPSLPNWNIRPDRVMDNAPVVGRGVMMVQEAAVKRSKNTYSAPSVQHKATYSLWKLGKRNIPAGESRLFNMSKEVWNADFSYLTRPSLGSEVFVSASVTHAEAKDLPRGTAFIYMEGTMLGSRQLDLTGKTVEMFFGSDPLLKAEFKTIQKASGEKGLFGSDQTYSWKYAMTITNSRNAARKIKVEEPFPVVGDKRIEIETESKPKAETENRKFVWEIEIPASSKSSIEYGVELKAPEDMKLDLGIGR
jgi:uncharacterized protein (TIGR02231 family)